MAHMHTHHLARIKYILGKFTIFKYTDSDGNLLNITLYTMGIPDISYISKCFKKKFPTF